MYRYLIIATLLFLAACHPNKHVTIPPNQAFLKDCYDSTINTQQLINKYLPHVLALAKSDTSNLYYGSSRIEEDSAWRCLLIGKIIDSKQIIAAELNLRDTMVRFYELNKESWKLIGEGKVGIPAGAFELIDLDGDGDNEIIVSTGTPNMNGNLWYEVFIRSHQSDTIKYAGAFSTDYVLDTAHRQLQETYEGSWYMDTWKTLYQWQDEMLVPIKKVVLAHNDGQSENTGLTFEYYENKTNSPDSLILLYSQPHTRTTMQDSVWDNFFAGR